MKKRLFCLALVLILAVGLMTVAFAATTHQNPSSTDCAGNLVQQANYIAPTCTSKGYWVHFKCDTCGLFFLQDKNSATTITVDTSKSYATAEEITAAREIPMIDHSATLVDKVPATCVATGTEAYYLCSGCNVKFKDQNCTNPYATVTIDKDSDNHSSIVAVAKKDATCTETGISTAYWTCEGCGKFYADRAAGAELDKTTVDGYVIAKLEHTWATVDKAKTVWARDYSYAMLTLKCSGNGCTATTVVKAPNVTYVTNANNETTYTASVTIKVNNVDTTFSDSVNVKNNAYVPVVPTYTYTLRFDTNGGSTIADYVTNSYYDRTVNLSKLVPTRYGYVFAGWYSDAALKNPITSITLNANRITTVYAGWYEGWDYWCSACDCRDVDINDWYHDEVRYVLDNDIMYTFGSWFNPGEALTRYQLVEAMYEIAGTPYVKVKGVFRDVSTSADYATAVEWAAANGIVQGIGNKTFDPYSNVTREQMAAIFFRFANYISKTGKTALCDGDFDWTYSTKLGFYDADDIHWWAEDAMAWCVENGILYGYRNYVNPQGSTTRAEAAAILTRFCK